MVSPTSNSASDLPILNPCCKQREKTCELATLSASQIGSAIAFLIILAVSAHDAIHGDSHEHGITLQFTGFLILSICYFFFGSWFVENRYIDVLRAMGVVTRWLEFIVRSGILISFAWFNNIIRFIQGSLTEHRLGKNNSILYALSIYLVALYVGFILWDLIVTVGIWRANRKRQITNQPPLVVMLTDKSNKRKKHAPPVFVERDANEIIRIASVLDFVGLVLSALLALLMYKDHPDASAVMIVIGLAFSVALLIKVFPDIMPISLNMKPRFRRCVR